MIIFNHQLRRLPYIETRFYALFYLCLDYLKEKLINKTLYQNENKKYKK